MAFTQRKDNLLLAIAALTAMAIAAGAVRAEARVGIRVTPVITVNSGRLFRTHRHWTPGHYMTRYDWETQPGRWENQTKTYREEGRWEQKWVPGKYRERTLPSGRVIKVCLRPGQYKRVFIPPKETSVTQRVWIPERRVRVAKRVWVGGCYSGSRSRVSVGIRPHLGLRVGFRSRSGIGIGFSIR